LVGNGGQGIGGGVPGLGGQSANDGAGGNGFNGGTGA